MHVLLEAGRIFASIQNRENTVRFVAADYEEISNNLDGDYAYVDYLRNQATAQASRFSRPRTTIRPAGAAGTRIRAFAPLIRRPARSRLPTPPSSSSPARGQKRYDYPELANGMKAVAATYGATVVPTVTCDPAGDTDHYPFWVAGIPGYVIEEWGSESNPHYDQTGNDTLDKINLANLSQIAKIQITFQAQLMGIAP